MKVMYFLFEGFDTENGTNHLALTTMQTFLENGIDVYLVTSHSKGLFPDVPDSIKDRSGFSSSVIPREEVEKKNFVRRYLDGISYAHRACKEWKKHREEVDAVVLQSTPTVFFSSVLLHHYMKKPVIFNSFDVFPDGPYLFGAIKNKFLFIVLAMMQSYVYKTSKRIVVISDDMKKTFLKKGIQESKLKIIPNWYDSDSIHAVCRQENRFVKKFNIDNSKFIVQYAGNFGYTFNYKAVIEVAKLLKSHEQIEFHMIGTGGFEEEFKNKVFEEGLANIRFFPWQESDMINDVYSSCDIAFVPLSKGVIWTSFPSKCTLLMACGRSFICMCEKKSHFYQSINRYHAGICMPVTDFEGAAREILNLSGDKGRLRDMEHNAKKLGEQYYSSATNAHKYVEIFKESIKEK